jgi:uncharacterized protein
MLIMETITYSICKGDRNSAEYYNVVRKFCNELVAESGRSVIPIVNEFIEYLRTYGLEEIREQEEYILDLLSFGVLWHKYSRKALAVSIAPFITLSKMAEWRKKHQRLKPVIDIIRGIFITLFLLPDKSYKEFVAVPTLEQIDHVCKWFEATGEFREQALRFIRWRAYWQSKNQEELLKIFSAVNEFTQWFEERAQQVLGKYTGNVEYFLQLAQARYRWREDRIQCTRSRLEYHLNMVGAELMNRAFHNEFKKTDTKVVLVPGCMRGRTAEKCEAIRTKEGLTCQGCLPKCSVNQLNMMGKKLNFSVYIIPHASDLSLWSPKKDRPLRGVIASACITTLVEGGWELKRYDVPAQCVLLDYCGCKKHWHKDGISTRFNLPEFRRILN